MASSVTSGIRRASHGILRPFNSASAASSSRRRFSELANFPHDDLNQNLMFQMNATSANVQSSSNSHSLNQANVHQQLSLATTADEINHALDLVEKMRELQKDRCEWQIHKTREKLMKMPHGTSIKSEPFSLLGVDDCFLEIYPLGDSVENIGYVSLYLGAPPGIDVLFTLWIGDVTTRPLLHKYTN